MPVWVVLWVVIGACIFAWDIVTNPGANSGEDAQSLVVALAWPILFLGGLIAAVTLRWDRVVDFLRRL